ncbi:MAG: hypothetical protein ACT4OM_05965 [Actinomycetota bacterium]
MSLRTVAFALLSVFLATAGQLLLKAGMTRVGYIGGDRLGRPMDLAMQVATTWQVLLGLTLFVVSSVFWLLVLSRVPLSFAYPFAGLAYVLITLFGKFVLREQVPGIRWMGIALIIAGILVVGRSSPADKAPAADAAPVESAVSS